MSLLPFAVGLFFFGQSAKSLNVATPTIPTTAEDAGENYLDHSCGISSLCVGARLLNRQVSFGQVCKLLPPEDRPRDLHELRDAAQAVGLTTMAIRWKRGQQLLFPSPAILHLRPVSGRAPGHFIVAATAVSSQIQVLDCPFSPTWISETDLWNYWDGVALYIAAGSDALSPLETHRPWWTVLAVLGCSTNSLALCLGLVAFGRSWIGAASVNWAWKAGAAVLVGAAIVLGAVVSDFLMAANRRTTPLPMPLVVANEYFKTVTISEDVLHEANTATLSFVLRNEGMKPARIVDVLSSCHCASTELEERTLPPGGQCTVDVSVDMLNEVTRDVFVVVRFDEDVIPSSITLRGRVCRISAQ